MKLKEKIYVPYRLIEKRETGELERQFCLDSKKRPRTYTSMLTLQEYMPKEYDGIAVYRLKEFQKLGCPKLSRKQKQKLRKMEKEKQRLNEFLRFNFYRDFPHIYSNLPIYPGRFKEAKLSIQEEERFFG